MSKSIFTTFGLLLVYITYAQETRDNFRYAIQKSAETISIDGAENDPIWSGISDIPNFINHWPVDSGQANALTQVKVTYDDEFIYVLALCYDNGSRVVQSLRRDDDDGHWNSDNFTLVIDPMNNRQNGFMFGVNAGGSQIEAQLNVQGPRTQYDQNWDNKWYSSVRSYEDHWTVEMAIPFKTLRYSPNQSE